MCLNPALFRSKCIVCFLFCDFGGLKCEGPALKPSLFSLDYQCGIADGNYLQKISTDCEERWS
jgi:hypothetical protein